MKEKVKFSGYAVFAGCLLLMIFPGGLLSYAPGLFMYPICKDLGFTTTAFSITNTVCAAVNALRRVRPDEPLHRALAVLYHVRRVEPWLQYADLCTRGNAYNKLVCQKPRTAHRHCLCGQQPGWSNFQHGDKSAYSRSRLARRVCYRRCCVPGGSCDSRAADKAQPGRVRAGRTWRK